MGTFRTDIFGDRPFWGQALFFWGQAPFSFFRILGTGPFYGYGDGTGPFCRNDGWERWMGTGPFFFSFPDLRTKDGDRPLYLFPDLIEIINMLMQLAKAPGIGSNRGSSFGVCRSRLWCFRSDDGTEDKTGDGHRQRGQRLHDGSRRGHARRGLAGNLRGGNQKFLPADQHRRPISVLNGRDENPVGKKKLGRRWKNVKTIMKNAVGCVRI